MHDISEAEPYILNGKVIGYLLQVNDDYWLPLTLAAKPAGPPTYRADAETTLRNQH